MRAARLSTTITRSARQSLRDSSSDLDSVLGEAIVGILAIAQFSSGQNVSFLAIYSSVHLIGHEFSSHYAG